MATRYSGNVTVRLKYTHESPDGRSVYAGSVTTKHSGKRYSWRFDDLQSGVGGVSSGKGYAYASDSPEAYDEMARSALSFATYYTSMNRSDDEDEPGKGFPDGETADAFDAECYLGESAHEVTRSR
jgi:hypothetical protein